MMSFDHNFSRRLTEAPQCFIFLCYSNIAVGFHFEGSNRLVVLRINRAHIGIDIGSNEHCNWSN